MRTAELDNCMLHVLVFSFPHAYESSGNVTKCPY